MGKYLEFFGSTWNFFGTWKILEQISPEMVEIQREIGVTQWKRTKFSACIKLINFEIGLKKIPGTVPTHLSRAREIDVWSFQIPKCAR